MFGGISCGMVMLKLMVMMMMMMMMMMLMMMMMMMMMIDLGQSIHDIWPLWTRTSDIV